MSQISSQIHDAAPISIPFVKFSHNTSPAGCRSFIWNHIGQRDDLRLGIQSNRVIDEQGNYATRIMLHITAGVDVLETQDLGQLVNFAREYRYSSGTEAPVQVVVRCPFMAMKYPKSINSVRRIQLKFNIEADFSKAVGVLTELGFPITESGPMTSVPRPSISLVPTPLSRTISAPPPASSSTLKSPSPYYNAITQLPTPYTTHLQGGLRETPSTALHAAHTVPLLENTLHPPQHQTQQEFSDQLQAQANLLGTSRFFTHPSPVSLKSSSAEPAHQSQCLNPPTAHLDRLEPGTSPNPSLDDELPPRRELPFPKLRESDRCASAPDLTRLSKSTAVLKADLLDEPATQGNPTPTPKPAKKRVAQRKPIVKKPPEAKPPVEAPTKAKSLTQPVLSRGVEGQEDEPSPLAAKSNAARPASASGLQTKATAAKKRPAPTRPAANAKKPKMVDQSTQTQTLSGRDHTSALALSSSNEEAPPAENAPTPPPQGYVDLINTLIATHQAGPAPKELWERPRYAEADDEQRQQILNDFICENLENSDFLQLCSDTEKAWRRIGLGM